MKYEPSVECVTSSTRVPHYRSCAAALNYMPAGLTTKTFSRDSSEVPPVELLPRVFKDYHIERESPITFMSLLLLLRLGSFFFEMLVADMMSG